jgi:hypothetical protein
MGCLEREKSAISGKTGIARCLSLFLRLIFRRVRQYGDYAGTAEISVTLIPFFSPSVATMRSKLLFHG